MRVDQTLAAEAAAAARTATARPATAPRTSFASALSGAVAGTTAARKATAASATQETKRGSETSAKEKTRPVEGKPYVEIVSGPRNGMFINKSGNARDGEAFVRIEKDGRDVHVYGSGKDRETVVMWHNEDKKPTAGGDGVPEGEVSARVEGRLYDEITAGPRNGMFINRSGNARDGLAFVLVKHQHREDHIYGSGTNTQIIRMWDEGYGPDAEHDAATPTTGGVGATGGTATT
jgi:lipoprotein-anchoring transpeptidase ErfK/SrfK